MQRSNDLIFKLFDTLDASLRLPIDTLDTKYQAG